MTTPTRAELDALRTYDTPTLANALDSLTDRPANTGYTRPPVANLLPSLPVMVGLAVTATIRSESPWPDRATREHAIDALYRAVRLTPAPRVVVVQDLDADGSGCLWGEVNATICRALDCEGVVTDGLVRDLPEVEAIGFRYVARGIGVSHAYVRVESTGEPIEVGGACVRPGDVIHADRHGALVVPSDLVSALPGAADAVVRRERALIRWVRSATFDPDDLMAKRIEH